MPEYALKHVTDEEMDAMITRQKEKSEFPICGYPLFISPDGRLYPEPTEEIAVQNGYVYIL